LRPLQLIVGLFGNSQSKLVLRMQVVMVESDASENYLGDPFAVLMPRSMKAYGFVDCVE